MHIDDAIIIIYKPLKCMSQSFFVLLDQALISFQFYYLKGVNK